MKKFRLQLTAAYEVSEAEVLNFLRQEQNDDSIQADDLTEYDYFNYVATWGDDRIAYGIDTGDWEIVDKWEE